MRLVNRSTDTAKLEITIRSTFVELMSTVLPPRLKLLRRGVLLGSCATNIMPCIKASTNGSISALTTLDELPRLNRPKLPKTSS